MGVNIGISEVSDNTGKAGPPSSSSVEVPTAARPLTSVEPCASCHLRTARSYAFLSDFLESRLGESTLKSLKGLREKGNRESDLYTELRDMRELFHGLYLMSAEDIGMKPALLADEPVDRDSCEKAATDWLAKFKTDPDLAADTRVAVPVSFDALKNTTRVWVTLGVRLTKFEAAYVKGPKVRPESGTPDWTDVEAYKFSPTSSLIPVDEFAEVEIPAGRVYNRDEFRAVCDALKTKIAIVKALKTP